MSGAPAERWRPTANLERLRLRACLLAAARAFFAARGVLEVETPALVHHAVSDLHLHSARVALPGAAGEVLFLHTSPEYAMKRLLAAGSGDIYQICHVFRGAERGRLHNPEFTLIEWYRTGLALQALIEEVAALVAALLHAAGAAAPAAESVSYREAFRRSLSLDPLEAAGPELERAAEQHLGVQPSLTRRLERDELLDLLMAQAVGPQLGRGRLTFVHGYPASQAALARLDPRDPRVALRFELYWEGVELANGFEELTSAAEQRGRFEQDQRARAARALPVTALDEELLAALEAGLPACSGVALGFDRLAMLAAGCASLEDVIAFPIERA